MNGRCLCLEFIAISATAALGVPVISEFMADNASGLNDGAGRHSDWIEIYNPDNTPADLTGWHLTDDAGNLMKWTFPAVMLPAGQRLLVFASSDGVPDSGGALHTNFSLDSSGEYLALVAPDGVTISTQFSPYFPPQKEDVSYGLSRTRTELLGPGASGKAAKAESEIVGNWHGEAEPFNDSAWLTVTNGIGFNGNATPIIPLASPPCAAYTVPSGTVGNQTWTGPLGLDFSAERPLSVTALGTFDSASDGLHSTIHVQLWSRDEHGTPENFADDTGLALLAEVEFSTANQGAPEGGNRFLPLAAPLALPIGAYSVIAWGYGPADPNGNSSGTAPTWTLCDSSGAITFDGAGRFGTTPGTFPTGLDGGPVNRYAAGTFKYTSTPPDLRRTAYNVTTGQVGNQAFGGSLGMDFQVTSPVRILSLGVFDDGSNGIASGAVITAQLWRRNDNGTPALYSDDTGSALLATQTFTNASGGTLEGGSRFKALAVPLELAPGAYTMSAYGYSANERNGNSSAAAPSWTTNGGPAGALHFTGTSRYAGTPGAFPNVPDGGPVNRYAAGTFQYLDGSDPLVTTDVSALIKSLSAGAYLRLTFEVPNPAAFGSYELEASYDDGFAAWLNGAAVASRNAPPSLDFSSAATAAGGTQELFSLPASAMHSGENMLAVHGLNLSASDADFLQLWRLTGISASAVAAYFLTPTPGAAEFGGVLGFVEAPVFSVDHGYYDAPFTVSLATTTPEAVIRYTTDGSAPLETSAAYTVPLTISTTTVLRAAAFLAGYQPSPPNTRTYLFLDQVVTQGAAPPGYPASWNAIAADYAMEDSATDLAAILGQPAGTPISTLRGLLKQSLQALPAICISTDISNLFDSASGIYANPSGRGDLWEKPCSAELIPQPGNTEAGFQINGGLQVMGLTSRNLTVNPRLPLRVIFSRRFGPPSLHYPLFPENPVTRFDSIALRNNTRDNWGYDATSSLYIRDQWCKEALTAMNQPSSSGRYFHLFLNGLYWGVYNPTERPDGDYCEEHLGGTADEWDSVTLCCPNRAKSGDLTAWQQLLTLSTQGFETDAKYEFVQGHHPDGTRNLAYEVLLDVDSLIHFLLSGYYHASGDWPGNFYAMRRRGSQSTGFQFITWDSDLGFTGNNVNADKTQVDAAFWWTNSPGQLDLALRAHPEYRLRFADAAHKHLFNGGSLTPGPAAQRFSGIAAALEPALGAEGSRWGDAKGLATLTQWRQNRDFFTASYFPNRTAVVITQLKARGLYPSLAAPVFSQHGGAAPTGYSLSMTAPSTIYYTLNSTDPRLRGGGISPQATAYAAPVSLSSTVVVKARTWSAGTWSALNEAAFLISTPATATNCVVSELHYNPDGDDGSEFVELANISTGEIDFSGVRFTAGVLFDFPEGLTLAPGGRLLVVKNRVTFEAIYGTGLPVVGEFSETTGLDNGGEELLLLARDGSPMAQFTYHDDAPWPNDPDGGGFSLTLIQPSDHLPYADPLAWRSSASAGGSPGTSDAVSFAGDSNEDQDHDGLSAGLEFALGTSDHDSSAGLAALYFDASSQTVTLIHHLAADAPPLVLESSADLIHWTSAAPQWNLRSRVRLSSELERLRFEPAADSAARRSYLRARLP